MLSWNKSNWKLIRGNNLFFSQTSKMLSSCLTEHQPMRWKSLMLSVGTWSGLWARILPRQRLCMSLENQRQKVGHCMLSDCHCMSPSTVILALTTCVKSDPTSSLYQILGRHADQDAGLWAVSAHSPTHLQGQGPRHIRGLCWGSEGLRQGREWHSHGRWAQARPGNTGWVWLQSVFKELPLTDRQI